MSRQVMKLFYEGTWLIEYDDKQKDNPYRIYLKYYKDGYHKKLMEKYEDLQSCMHWFLQRFTGHEWRMI